MYHSDFNSNVSMIYVKYSKRLYEHVCGKHYETLYLITVNVSYFARFQINCCLHPGEGKGRRNMQTETGLLYCNVCCVCKWGFCE